MRLVAAGRRLLAVAVLTACAGDAGDATPTSAMSVAIATRATTTSTTTRPTATAPDETTSSTTTTTGPTATTTGPPPSVATTCQPPAGDVVATPSGRRALLRAVAAPAPLIVVLHGYTGTPEGIERYAELTQPANDRGVAVAYPAGTATPDGGSGWATGASVFATDGVDDVAALGDLLDALVATGCIDPDRITLTGESNGGGMALVAACAPELAGRFERVVAVNAAVDDAVLARCGGGSPAIPLTVVAGALDETVPLEGTEALAPVDGWFATAAAALGRCTEVTSGPPLDDVVSRAAGRGCAACSELLVVADGTHTWPGTTRGVSGLRPGSLALNALLLAAPPGACLSGLP